MRIETIHLVSLAVLCGCADATVEEPDGGADGDLAASMDGDATDGGATDDGGAACEIPTVPDPLADCGFDLSLAFDHLWGTTLQLQSADGEYCARIERRDDTPFPAESAVLWTLVEARVGRRGNVASVADVEALCWRVTHHNWEDAARIWTGATRYDVELITTGGHSGDVTYALRISEQGPLDPADTYCIRGGTTPLCDPVELFPVTP